ncbi:hypothetical protein [Kribbella sp. NPDC049584]
MTLPAIGPTIGPTIGRTIGPAGLPAAAHCRPAVLRPLCGG